MTSMPIPPRTAPEITEQHDLRDRESPMPQPNRHVIRAAEEDQEPRKNRMYMTNSVSKIGMPRISTGVSSETEWPSVYLPIMDNAPSIRPMNIAPESPI